MHTAQEIINARNRAAARLNAEPSEMLLCFGEGARMLGTLFLFSVLSVVALLVFIGFAAMVGALFSAPLTIGSLVVVLWLMK